ncbi:MAG: type II toxin-antitoxin system antitoxin, RelB/DinJ family [Gammaproteobacteria bacterium]|nr:MAG: type II toxin-antitoxin system antitoxin, RelB/DinJ family [Gammaproteobacteria bacterium]
MIHNKTDKISARIQPNIKKRGNAILSSIGIKPSDAITLFYHQIIIHRGLPFEARLPNDETIEAINELKDPNKRARLKKYDNVEQLMADLDS